jgi:SAM-dependent methyltransferase
MQGTVSGQALTGTPGGDTEMEQRRDFLRAYVAVAPLALAFERTLECQLYAERPIERPVLDIGCGEGLFAKILFTEKVNTGIDPNPSELERARELDAYDELIQCEGALIPKPDCSYKTIFSNSVLEHIPDLEPVLREAYRLLVPGGRFYFTVPLDRFDQYSAPARLLQAFGLHSLAVRYRRFYNRFWRHHHYYPLACWKELAQRAGFEVVEAFPYGSRGMCLVNDLLAPLAFPRLLVKKATNRWVLFPKLRAALMYPIYLLARGRLRGGGKDPGGGLVFVSLTKH